MTPQIFNSETFQEQSKPINTNDLSNEMATISSFLGYYGEQAIRWRKRMDDIKQEIAIRSADIGITAKNSGDKVTEGTIDRMIEQDADIKALKAQLGEINEQYGLFNHAVNTFVERAKMASSIGANRRAELEYGITSSPVKIENIKLTDADRERIKASLNG